VLLYNRGHEVQPVAAHGPVEHTSVIVLEELQAYRSRHHITHLRHGALRLHSLGEVAMIGEWILLLLCACIFFC
jgi:hypothetical protein